MTRVLHNSLWKMIFPNPPAFQLGSIVAFLWVFACTNLQAFVISPDSTRPAGIRTTTVYKYNAEFTDSTRVFYEEIDPMNKVLKSEGRIFFTFPLVSSENFELAQSNIGDGDTIFDTYNLQHICPVGSMECSAFVMKYDSAIYRPLSIKHYGCHMENNKHVFENVLLDEAFFTYEYSPYGKKITMKVYDPQNKMTELISRTYDKEGRIICTQWEVPQDEYYYKAFYTIYYK